MLFLYLYNNEKYVEVMLFTIIVNYAKLYIVNRTSYGGKL
jgi:hypothetical protein